VAFVIDSVAYSGLGEAGSEQYPKQFYKYEAGTDRWTEIASFPGTGREFAVAFTIGGFGYVGLGFSFAGVDVFYYKDFYRYDPVADVWTAIADFGGEPRVKAVAFVLDSIAYAGTGSNSGVMLDDFWKYDVNSNSWSVVGTMQMPDPFHGAATSVVDGKAYLVGGRGNAGVYFEHILEFDPANGESWALKKTIQGLTIEDGTAFALDHQVYFGYGGNASGLMRFDPATGVVSDFGSLPELKSINRGPVAFSIDSTKAYFGLGYSSVVANQPASYRNQFWQLEVEVISGIPQQHRLSTVAIARISNDTYQIIGENEGPYALDVFTTSGIRIASLPSISLYEQFKVQGYTAMYVFNLRNQSGDFRTDLIFNKSE
jgi:N-acetylneuraminic acid mutarotase